MILCVIYIQQRHHLISSSYDCTLKQWDLNVNTCVNTFRGHTDYVNCICQIDEHGDRIASGSSDWTIKIWSLSTAKCLCTLRGHQFGVNYLIYIKQTNRLVSGSSDGTIKVWLGNVLMQTLYLHGWCSCLVATKYTNEIISSTDDSLIKIWDLSGGKCLRVLQGHKDSVNFICLVENESRLVSCSDDRTIKVWLTTHNYLCLYTICDAHADWIVTLCYLGFNRRSFASGSCDHTIRVWNVETGECEKVFEGHADWVRALALIEPIQQIKSEMSRQEINKEIEKKEKAKICCILC